MKGQIELLDYLKSIEQPKPKFSCSDCYCKDCLYWWSSRCPYGICWDDHRAEANPYTKTFQDNPPRTGWSDWSKRGEQEHWCRGGMFYPERKCKHYVKYKGQSIEECVDVNIAVFQDGYVQCSLKEAIGCDACIARAEGQKINDYACEHMTDSGCEKMFAAKSLILDAIMEGEDIEPCTEQCCIGCNKVCGYRCGQGIAKRK